VDAALELVYTEYVIREELGRQLALSNWFGRFPQWRERLERVFQIGELLDDVGELLTDDDSLHPAIVSAIRYGSAAAADADALDAVTVAEADVDAQGMASWTDQYELLEKIGRGGMGVVYKAWQHGLHRMVALKMIRAGEDATPQELARFRREAENVARLQHPNIVQSERLLHEVVRVGVGGAGSQRPGAQQRLVQVEQPPPVEVARLAGEALPARAAAVQPPPPGPTPTPSACLRHQRSILRASSTPGAGLPYSLAVTRARAIRCRQRKAGRTVTNSSVTVR
jgi:hypothetical protein